MSRALNILGRILAAPIVLAGALAMVAFIMIAWPILLILGRRLTFDGMPEQPRTLVGTAGADLQRGGLVTIDDAGKIYPVGPS